MKALIISLNFNPGHVSHMVASYKQLEELGYKPFYYVNEAFVPFLPQEGSIIVFDSKSVPSADIAFFVFPSQKNLFLIRKLKKHGTKIIYIFHEPLSSMKNYKDAGFSYKYLVKLWLINRINSLTVKWSDVVLLPSQKAVEYYEANPLYGNRNYHYLPLLYDDERNEENKMTRRVFFSYIGTIAADHSFSEYIEFVKWAVTANRLPKIQFLIATKSEFEVSEELLKSPRVFIRKGKPLRDEEINGYYAATYIVWNAYTRTTQSGVLAKSFMFGTPAIVLKKNLSEFTEDGKEVVAIEDNTSLEQIEGAVNIILSSFPSFSTAARKRFEDTFYYKRYNADVEEIIR